MTSMKKNLSTERLRFLFQIARRRKTGVLTLRGGKSPRNFWIERGSLRMVAGADPTATFTSLVSENELVKPRKLNKALKNCESRGGCLLSHLEELGAATREDLSATLDHGARRELTRLIDEDGGSLRFVTGALDLEPFGEGVEDYLLNRDLGAWVLDAAAARGTTEIFDPVFPTDQDVPMLSAEGGEPAATEAATRVLPLIDGLRTIAEIVDASAVDRFSTLRGIFELEASGGTRRRTLEEILELAHGFQSGGRIDQSQKMYRLAQMHGADALDVSWNLARNSELMGDTDAAVTHYLDYCAKAEEREDRASALRALRRGIEIQPEDLRLRESAIRLLDAAGATEDAAKEIRQTIPLLLADGSAARARELLTRLVLEGLADERVCGDLADCCESEGVDPRDAMLELAEELAGKSRPGDALPLLDHLVRTRAEDVEMRLRKAVLASEAGRGQEMTELLRAAMPEVEEIPREGDGGLTEWARRGLEVLVTAEPDERVAREWLAACYRSRGADAEASRQWTVLARLYERAEDSDRLCEALSELRRIAPEDREHRTRLGRAWIGVGREAAGVSLLREVAAEWVEEIESGSDEGEARSDALASARAAIDEILGIAPQDLDALELRIRLLTSEGDEAAALAERARGVELALLFDRIEFAESWIDEIPEGDLDARILVRLADARASAGSEDEALEALREAARLEHASRNFGAMEAAASRVLEAIPEDEEMLALVAPPEPVAEEAPVEETPVESDVPDAAPARAEEPASTGASAFGGRLLEIMNAKPAPKADTGAPAPAPAPAPTPEPAAVPRAEAPPRPEAVEAVSEASAVREVEVPSAPADAEIEGAEGTPTVRPNLPEDKPSISGIVARLKSMR